VTRETLSDFFSGRAGGLLRAEQIDRLCAEFPPPDNVRLQFRGFDPGVADLPALAYYRSVYTLYPRRVFAADPSVPLNSGRDLLQTPWEPTDAWLDEHHVAWLAQFQRAPDGGIAIRTFRR
jgi:hypothetical protein